MSIGLRLKILRLNRKESLKQVSKATGLAASHINSMENDTTPNPAINTLKKLADYYKVSTAYIIEGGPKRRRRK